MSLNRFSHQGVILDVSQRGADTHACSMGSVFSYPDEPNKLLLFYTYASDIAWSKSAIGLAISTSGSEFRKSKQPILEGREGSFCSRQALNPVVVRLGNRFYMVLSGAPDAAKSRRIGIAYADDPVGPWRIIGELAKPMHFWEGNGIDNGCSAAKLNDESFLFFYSSLTSPKAYDIQTFVRRYPVRRIGILKVRVRGASLSSIEVLRHSDNPLKHLNGPKGSWNESVFCPGYIKLGDTNCLFPTGSTYSVGYPYKQYVGVITSRTLSFDETDTQPAKLIDGPKEKSGILPDIKSEIALDTPCPYLDQEKKKLHLYYSVADRADEKWKIALTVYDLHSKIK